MTAVVEQMLRVYLDGAPKAAPAGRPVSTQVAPSVTSVPAPGPPRQIPKRLASTPEDQQPCGKCGCLNWSKQDVGCLVPGCFCHRVEAAP
jgi:hypothetical protein